jgi:LysR family transcriptional regulator, chromosome initiation inhibitor
MGQLDYRALAVLDAVASQGSFEKAALALGISQSAVSQRIKVLEDASGRLLIVRGQPALPTGLGQRLISHYRNVKLMEAALDIDLGNQVSMPEVALAIDAGSLSTWFPDSLAPLMAPPRCQLDVRLADSDTALQLVRDGSVFGCVAASPETVPGMHAAAPAGGGTEITALGVLQYVCVATPVFAGHWFGDGFSVEAVRLAPAVVSEAKLMQRFIGQHLAMNEPFPHHTLPAAAVLEDCIGAGLAYGLMPKRRAAAALAAGQLVDLLPGHTLDLPLSWFTWHLDTPFTKLLSEQIVGSARAYLVQP